MRLRPANVACFVLNVTKPRARPVVVEVGVWLTAPWARRGVLGVEALPRHGPATHDSIEGSHLRVGSPFAQDLLGTPNGLEVRRALLETSA